MAVAGRGRCSTTTTSSPAAVSRSSRSGTAAFLPGTVYFRDRGIVVITSQNFDGEWIARIIRAVRLRHGARVDVARRARARWCRCGAIWQRAVRSGSRSTVRADRRASRSRAPCWLAGATGHPIAAVPPRGGARLDGRQLGSRRRCRSRSRRVSARRSASRWTCPDDARGDRRGWAGVDSERTLVALEQRARCDTLVSENTTHDPRRVAAHSAVTSRRPAIPSGRARGRVRRASPHGWRGRGGDVAEPRAATREELRARPRRGARRRDRGDRGPGGDARRRHVHVAGVVRRSRCSPPGAADAARPSTRSTPASRRRAGASARPSRRARSRDGLLPSTTTSRSPRRTRWRAALTRVAIVDIDVHHGNGTQWMFYDDPRVLYVSTHQFPFYPGTGAADEIGHGRGRRLHRQHPARGGRDGRGLRLVLRARSSAGARAVRAASCCWSRPASTRTSDDPLASMRMTTAGYAMRSSERAARSRRRCRSRS